MKYRRIFSILKVNACVCLVFIFYQIIANTQYISSKRNIDRITTPEMCDQYLTGNNTSTTLEDNDLSLKFGHQQALKEELQKETLKGLLVYDCSKSNKGSCGGWSDRISGIYTSLVLSILTERKFKIQFTDPCQLSEYLQPHHYNWTFSQERVPQNSTSSFHSLQNILYHKMGKELSAKVLHAYFKADVCFVRINWDLTKQLRKYPNIQQYVPWITELHFSDLYKLVFNFLFKLSPEIEKTLHKIRKNASKAKTACAHLRMGNNPSMYHDLHRTTVGELKPVWKFLEGINDLKVYNIFVATDDDKVRKMAQEKFKDNIIDIPGRILHIDQSRYMHVDVCDGFRKQLLDFLFLSTCDILVLSKSGFGIMAAYLRDFNSGLYCWVENGVVPCSRYTAHEFYPDTILAPT